MIEPLQFTFALTKSDYITALRSFLFHQKSMRNLNILALLVIFYVVFYFITTGYFSWILLVIVFLFYGFLVFLHPAAVGEKVDKDPRLHSETTWVIDENKVSIHDPFNDTSVDWGTFAEALETDELYLLCDSVARASYKIVPKRAFTSTEQQQEYRRLVEAKRGTIRRIRSVPLPEPSARTVKRYIYGMLGLAIVIVILISYLQASGK